MRNNCFALIVIGLFLLIACGNKPNPEVAIATCDAIPKDAIPFEYNRGKTIILQGMLNDSIPLKLLFDTGGGSWINLTDRLKGKFGLNKSGFISKLAIGKYTKYIPIDFNLGKVLSAKVDPNYAIINWKYFDNEIIKISFQHKYIQVLENNVNTTGYDSIKMKLIQSRQLIIPTEIHLQGKVINEDLWFDTGCNVPIFIHNDFVTKYALNIDSAEHSPGITHAGNAGFSWVKADSARVGNHFAPIYTLVYGEVFKSENYSGLIGNAFFENFDIILDFKNFVLYLKPINDEKNSSESSGQRSELI